MEWYELRPYKIQIEDIQVSNMRRILGHIDKLLLIASKDKHDKIRIFIRVMNHHKTTLDSLDGIESIPCKPFNFDAFTKHTRYHMRRHCAIPITPKEVSRTSVYKTLNVDVREPACVAIYLRKMDSAPPINEYISILERGQSPDSIWRHVTSGSAKPSTRARDKIKDAREKISTRNLFLCKVGIHAMNKEDSKYIQDIFPAKAFDSKSIKPKKVKKFYTGGLSIPFIGAAKSVILADFEILGFIVMPSDADLSNANFEFGRVASEVSAAPSQDID